MSGRWSKKRKALFIAAGVFAASCVLYLWLPYRVAMVQMFIWLGGSRLMIPLEYRPLDEPRYAPIAEVPEYPPEAEVLSLEGQGPARAIPVKRIAWHLVVNEQVDGEPVVVTLCTVTNAALAYRAAHNGQELHFAPARLARNNLVLRDRETGSSWQQFTGQAIEGPLAGAALSRVPLARMRLDQWRQRYPAGIVLEPAGSDRDCCAPNDTCPVMSYFPFRPFLLQRPTHEDRRWPRKQPVVGVVSAAGEAMAFPVLPTARAEPNDSLQLRCYWFAWTEFYPDTKLGTLPGRRAL
jgi:hypothetical protein